MNERKSKFLTEKTVSRDISGGKETIPITAVNGEDFEQGPSGYVYVKNNVITAPLPIDRNIANLQHCNCKDNCQVQPCHPCCISTVLDCAERGELPLLRHVGPLLVRLQLGSQGRV